MIKYLNCLTPFPLIGFFLLIHFLLFLAFRYVVYGILDPYIIDRTQIPYAFYIGLKFDARYAVFSCIPLIISLFIPSLERLVSQKKSFYRKIICIVQSIIFFLFLLVYLVDFAVYFYTKQRLDLSIIEFIENPYISGLMVWQTYPIIKILIAFVFIILIYYYFINFLLKKNNPVRVRPRTSFKKNNSIGFQENSISFSLALILRIFTFLIIAIMGYGQISLSLFPLRWSNAYFNTDKNLTLLAIHPIQNVYDTLHIFKVKDPEIPNDFNGFARMADYLGSDNFNLDEKSLQNNFLRIFKENDNKKHNIIIIMMESLTTNKTSLDHGMSSLYSNEVENEFKLDPTPFLKKLADNSLYYPNFFSNSRTTARSIFATMTGIPDVNFHGGTSSRNPRSINQNLIFDQFDNYEKYYLIGGNANWANIRGILQNNIEELKLYEDNYWQAPINDVWGVSDLALLRESIDLFNQQSNNSPFIAFIQTAGFHRPFTIPKDNMGFKISEKPSTSTLEYWGFESNEEYQSLRFSDHALKIFFELAEKTNWYDDTIFVIYGDHGIQNKSKNMNKSYANFSLQAWHVPLIIHAPNKIITGLNPALHSQIDIFPTLADMVGIEYANTAFGKSMLFKNEEGLFIPIEFSKRYLAENNEFTYVYDQELAKTQSSRVYIGVNEDLVYLLENDYAYLYDFPNNISVLNNLKSLQTQGQNLYMKLPKLRKIMHEKLLDFYYSAKKLIQNNPKIQINE